MFCALFAVHTERRYVEYNYAEAGGVIVEGNKFRILPQRETTPPISFAGE